MISTECPISEVSTARLRNRLQQRGYVLITLMLALALMMIALVAALPDLKQQIRRDREEELRHCGTAYMRAIQHFYRKFGRYPSGVEELENTNNIRFLRKHYMDPMSRDPATGKEKDFKLLHQADIALNNGPVLPGQNGVAGQGGFPTQGGVEAQAGGASGQISENGDSGDASSSGNSDASGNSNSPGSSSSNSDAGSNSGLGFNGPTFGGGPILGVASTSKAKTIHVFFGKDHYNDWLFIYVQGIDRGGLLTGPVNPSLPTANLGSLTPGTGQQSMPNTGPTQVVSQPQQNPGQTPTQQ
ncbi:MAG: type IV pilin protein [Terriglobales bacterium]